MFIRARIRTEDLRDVLAGLPTDLRGSGVILVGYSLGGNAVLKLLGESGEGGAVLAVASSCTLRATTRRSPTRNLGSASAFG